MWRVVTPARLSGEKPGDARAFGGQLSLSWHAAEKHERPCRPNGLDMDRLRDLFLERVWRGCERKGTMLLILLQTPFFDVGSE